MKGYICSFLAAVLVFISGCGTIQVKENRDSFLVITDSAAREVTIPKKPERIVLLTPTLAEIQNALGGSFIGMAAPSEETVKMYGADKSYVGRPYQINMEQLVSLKPDLVIGLQGLHNGLEESLSGNHIPFLLLPMASYDDVKKVVHTLSQVAGDEEKGRQIENHLDQTMADIAGSIPKENLSFAVIHGTGKSLTIENKNSIACDVAEKMGMVNVFSGSATEKLGNRPPFSMEELAIKDPDVIFLTTMVQKGKEDGVFAKSLMNHPAWKGMKAVKTGRVYLLPQDLFLSSPGIRYPDALRYMSGKVYPEANKNISG